MISFTYPDNVAVNWDGDKNFTVTRDKVTVDSFAENETPTFDHAQRIADEYIEEKLQDEMFRDADEMQDQNDEEELMEIVAEKVEEQYV